MTDEILTKIYYKPENMVVGRKAIQLLKNQSGLSLEKVKSFLAKQAIWQVHIPPPLKIEHPHYYVTEVNKIHQADIMYLPHDKYYLLTYKYVLNVIDVASRYKASRPLRSKKASEVADRFRDIYRKGPLKYPKELYVDNGTEFRSAVDQLMTEHKVSIKQSTTKYQP